jgi:chromosome segregation ATPase
MLARNSLCSAFEKPLLRGADDGKVWRRSMMLWEERVGRLERRVDEGNEVMADMRSDLAATRQGVVDLRDRFDRFEVHVDRQFEAIRQEFDGVYRRAEADRQTEAINRRFDAIDKRFDRVDDRFDRLEDRMSRQFMWLVGLLVTVGGAIMTAVLTR